MADIAYEVIFNGGDRINIVQTENGGSRQRRRRICLAVKYAAAGLVTSLIIGLFTALIYAITRDSD